LKELPAIYSLAVRVEKSKCNGKKVLFGGDAAMTNKFKPLKNESIDLAVQTAFSLFF